MKYELGQIVRLVDTDEQGTVIACAEYLHCESNYLVRYRAADGKQTEAWWNESALA